MAQYLLLFLDSQRRERPDVMKRMFCRGSLMNKALSGPRMRDRCVGGAGLSFKMPVGSGYFCFCFSEPILMQVSTLRVEAFEAFNWPYISEILTIRSTASILIISAQCLHEIRDNLKAVIAGFWFSMHILK